MFQTCILNLHEDHTMCASMADIQFAMAEIRRGKKERKQTKPQGKNIMSASATQGGDKKLKQGLVTSYNIQPGNGVGLFLFWHFIIHKLVTYLLT